MFDNPIERRLREAPLAQLDPHAEARIAAALTEAARRPAPSFSVMRVAAALILVSLATWLLVPSRSEKRPPQPSVLTPIVVRVALDRPLFSRIDAAERLNILRWR